MDAGLLTKEEVAEVVGVLTGIGSSYRVRASEQEGLSWVTVEGVADVQVPVTQYDVENALSPLRYALEWSLPRQAEQRNAVNSPTVVKVTAG